MIFTDSHAHLQWLADHIGAAAFDELLSAYDRASFEAESKGLESPLLVDIGTEPDDLPLRIDLLDASDRRRYLRLTAGLWPSVENLAEPHVSIERLQKSIEDARACGFTLAALGEGGLDYHHMNAQAGTQAELFELQLDLALRLGLPMIVHSRKAFEDTFSIVSRWTGRGLRVLIHCFGYGKSEAAAFLDAGCYISFAGNLTYKGSEDLREACAIVPDDRLLIETDSPYMNPMPNRGKNSSPLDIERTYAAAALIRKSSVETLAESVSRNARKLFG